MSPDVTTTGTHDGPAPRTCRRCLLHSGLPGIVLDAQGVCNNCAAFDGLLARFPLGEVGRARLETVVARVKAAGIGHRYDCVVGVSGGTDSMYSLYQVCRLGLRPLAVHFDNGWNTQVAVRNIRLVLQRLGIDLWTYVVDWPEFRDLQLSFLKAGVPSVEAPTDMAIWSVLYRTAARFGVRHIISGNCFRAEGIVPRAWGFKDARLIAGIQRRHGTERLRTFPNFSPWDYGWLSVIRRIRFVRLLNYFDYSKEEAKAVLSRELGWVDYGGHHHESIYTRFFQSHLARHKFNMDRRLISLSARVRLGKLTREEALAQAQQADYTDFLLEDDRKYVAKKFGIPLATLDAIVATPPGRESDYPTYEPLIRRMRVLLGLARRFDALDGIFQAGRFS